MIRMLRQVGSATKHVSEARATLPVVAILTLIINVIGYFQYFTEAWVLTATRDGAAGGPLIQLTTSEKDDENPCFSPDGKSILFASNRTGNFDLYVMDADGRNLRQLTSDAADERQPCWTPDGNIYYTREMNLLVSNIWRIPAPK